MDESEIDPVAVAIFQNSEFPPGTNFRALPYATQQRFNRAARDATEVIDLARKADKLSNAGFPRRWKFIDEDARDLIVNLTKRVESLERSSSVRVNTPPSDTSHST
jgi:hypothetical protein